jgi:hypothetical protein
MYVPAAVVVGAVVDDAIAGRLRESVVVALGAGLVLVVSPSYSLTGVPSELLVPGIVLASATVLVVWSAPIRRWLSGGLPSSAFAALARLAPVVVALVLVGSFVGVPPVSGESPQQSLAEELDRQSPDRELVFIESEMEVAFHTFSFYAQRPLESGPVTRLESSGARYAILTEDSLAEAELETTIIANRTVSGGQQVSLVEVER